MDKYLQGFIGIAYITPHGCEITLNIMNKQIIYIILVLLCAFFIYSFVVVFSKILNYENV